MWQKGKLPSHSGFPKDFPEGIQRQQQTFVVFQINKKVIWKSVLWIIYLLFLPCDYVKTQKEDAKIEVELSFQFCCTSVTHILNLPSSQAEETLLQCHLPQWPSGGEAQKSLFQWVWSHTEQIQHQGHWVTAQIGNSENKMCFHLSSAYPETDTKISSFLHFTYCHFWCEFPGTPVDAGGSSEGVCSRNVMLFPAQSDLVYRRHGANKLSRIDCHDTL